MKLADAMKRIEELERKVRELEARQPMQIHYHYAQPVYQPLSQPAPGWNPFPTLYGQNGDWVTRYPNTAAAQGITRATTTVTARG